MIMQVWLNKFFTHFLLFMECKLMTLMVRKCCSVTHMLLIIRRCMMRLLLCIKLNDTHILLVWNETLWDAMQRLVYWHPVDCGVHVCAEKGFNRELTSYIHIGHQSDKNNLLISALALTSWYNELHIWKSSTTYSLVVAWVMRLKWGSFTHLLLVMQSDSLASFTKYNLPTVVCSIRYDCRCSCNVAHFHQKMLFSRKLDYVSMPGWVKSHTSFTMVFRK